VNASIRHIVFILARYQQALLVSSIIVGLYGCTSTSTLNTSVALTGRAEEVFHYQVQGSSNPAIQLRDGRNVKGGSIRIERDSLFWDADTGQMGVPLTEVQRVTGKNHVNGMLEGFGLGLLGGALVGAGLGAVADGEATGHPNISGPVIGLVFGGTLGGLGGLIIGVIQGHTYTYEFSDGR